MTPQAIVHAVILLALMVVATLLAIRGLIGGDLAAGIAVAAAGISAPSPFGQSSTTSTTDTAGLSSGA